MTKREWPLDDVSGGVLESVLLPAGTYELESIPAPGSDEGRWLKVKGTTLGWPEHRWLDWRNPSYGTFQIEVAPIKFSKESRCGHIEALLDEDTVPSVVEAAPQEADVAIAEAVTVRCEAPTAEVAVHCEAPTAEVTVRCETPTAEVTVLCEPPAAARPRTLSWSGLRFLLF